MHDPGRVIAGGERVRHRERTDEALVLACRRGDAAAWEALIARYQRLIYSIPRRAGLGEEQAADVFQQVFATLLEHLERIEQPARIGSWLATTARRETWRVSRQNRLARTRTRTIAEDGAEDDAARVPDSAPLPDELLLRLEEQQRIRTAVGALDDRCRGLITVLFLRPDPPTLRGHRRHIGHARGEHRPDPRALPG